MGLAEPVSLFAIIALLFGGVVFSFPALVPPIHSLAQHSQVARLVLVLALALLAYLSVFLPLARLSAGTLYARGLVAVRASNPFGFLDDLNELMHGGKDAIIDELWMRQMTPPSLRPQCYSAQPQVCQRADAMVSALGAADWNDAAFLRLAGTGLVSVAINIFLVWIITTKPRTKH